MAGPYTGVPEVAPEVRSPDDYQHVQANPSSFGGQIAQGLEKLGHGAEQASGNLFNIAEFQGKVNTDYEGNNYLESRNKVLYGDPDKVVTGPDGQRVPDTGYMGLQGRAAADQRPIVLKQLADLRDEGRNRLSSPQEQLAYDSQTRRIYAEAEGHVGQHAETQWKGWAGGVNAKGADLALNGFLRNFDQGNPSALTEPMKHYASDYINFKVQEAQTKYGLDPTIAEDAAQNAKRDLARARIDALGVNNPVAARDLAEKEKALLGDNYPTIANGLRVRAIQQKGITAGESALVTAARPGEGQASALDMTAIGETGRAGREGQAQIAIDTGGSLSYGILGLNSRSGSAAQFARENPQLRLTAEPGSPEFNAQWRQAAAKRPDELYAAQKNWYDRHVVANVPTKLRDAGINDALASDPRVVAYMSDRAVQMGDVGLNPALSAAARASTPAEFIAAVSAADKTNLQSNFSTYLSEHPDRAQGLLNRIDTRARLSAGNRPDTEESTDAIRERAYQNLDPSLTPEEKQHAVNHINQVVATKAREQSIAAKMRKEMSESTESEIFRRIHSDDPNLKISDIIQNPNLSREAMERMTAQFESRTKDHPEALYGKGFWDQYQRVHLPDGNPDRLTDPDQIYPMVSKGGPLTPSGANRLVEEIKKKRTVDGEHDSANLATFFKVAHGEISGTSDGLRIKDPKGDQLFAQFQVGAFQAYEKGIKAGKSSSQLLDEKSPDYIGKAIGNFKRPMAQWYADQIYEGGTPEAAFPQKGENPAPSFNPAAIQSMGELQSAYMGGKVTRDEAMRIAVDRGWARRPAAPPPPVTPPPVAGAAGPQPPISR